MNINTIQHHNSTKERSCRPIILSGEYTTLERKIIEYSFTQLCKINPHNKSRHISVLLKGRKIIEYGVNDERSTYTNRWGYLSRHSEFHSIWRYLKFHTIEQLSKLYLYNCRINRYNEIANSRPCRRCASLLEFFPVKSVFYTTETGRFEQWQI